jgi:hypothetical protein
MDGFFRKAKCSGLQGFPLSDDVLEDGEDFLFTIFGVDIQVFAYMLLLNVEDGLERFDSLGCNLKYCEALVFRVVFSFNEAGLFHSFGQTGDICPCHQETLTEVAYGILSVFSRDEVFEYTVLRKCKPVLPKNG